MNYINIAIDGPSAAGKSSLSRILAKRFGMTYVDTGAIYRAIGLYMFRRGVDCGDAAAVVPLLDAVEVSIQYSGDVQHILLCGEDVSEEIRRHEISDCASKVSAIPEVREKLIGLQRSIAKSCDCIMDGRDIGTVVLPNATLKVFLTASAEDRALRRKKELDEKGESIPYEKLLEDIRERDRRDSMRSVAPLKPAPDSIQVDTSGNSLSDSVELLSSLFVKTLSRFHLQAADPELNPTAAK